MYINLKEKSSFLKNYLFLKNLKYQNAKKRIISPTIKKNDTKSLSLQKLDIFIRTFKMGRYKNKLKKPHRRKHLRMNILNVNRLRDILKNKRNKNQGKNKTQSKNKKKVKKQTFKKLRYRKKKRSTAKLKNSIFYKIFILNYSLNHEVLKKSYVAFKQWNYVLFSRSIGLFVDFVKIVSLISQHKINISALGYLLSLVFRTLHKRKHGKFFYFAREMIDHLIESKKIKGIQLEIRGRLKGKTRANNKQFKKGTLDLNASISSLEYTQFHTYTLYGVYGFKLWINYNK